MKTLIILVCILMAPVVWAGDAGHPPEKVPEEILNIHPELDCAIWGQAGGYDLRGEICKSADESYLILYVHPEIKLDREPNIDIHTGFAIYAGKLDQRYFYRLGKLPKFKDIGSISFPAPAVNKEGPRDQLEAFDMERITDSHCLKLIHHSSFMNFKVRN